MFRNCLRISIPVLLLVCAGLFPVNAWSQHKALLWRIDRPGATRPSYLYGTMHLPDKRLFNLEDSVYHAIESTDGAAIELSPDQMVAYIINQVLDKMLENPKKLRELLDEKAYRQYAGALEKKFKKPAADITARDIVAEKHSWVGNYLSGGEMPTFLDLWLYSVARQQGKWLGGIEDMSDQAAIIDGALNRVDLEQIANEVDPAKTRAGFERLVNLYISQDIDAMQQAVAAGDNSGTLSVNRRNVKMARRMDSLSALRPMFFAVGAAHLAGDSGVIHFLRERGFRVSPVRGSRKLHADKYSYKQAPAPWVPVSDADGLYDAVMPGNPSDLKFFGIVESKFLFDLYNMSGYCTMAVPAEADIANPEQMYDRLAENMFKGAARYTNVIQAGLRGREYISQNGQLYYRGRIFVAGRATFMAIMYSVRKDQTWTPEADSFLKSFTPHPGKLAGAGRFRSFTGPDGGYTLKVPVRLAFSPKLSSNSGDDPWESKVYAGTDLSRGAHIMLIDRRLRAGHHITGDTAVLGELARSMVAKYGGICEPFMLDGHNGWRLRSVAEENVSVRVQALQRGNRTIVLLVLGANATPSPELEEVFGSLKLLPYAPASVLRQAAPEAGFSAMAPEPFRSFEYADGQHCQISYDPASGTTFFVGGDTLSEYSWFDSRAAYWKDIDSFYTSESGQRVMSIVRNPDSHEWTTQSKGDRLISRRKLVMHGPVRFMLSAYGDPAVIGSPAADSFFLNFRPLGAARAFDLTASKADLIVRDLKHRDIGRRQRAFAAIHAASFTRADLPVLHRALIGHFPSPYDSSGKYLEIVNSMFALPVAKLRDSSTVRFIATEFPRLRGADTGIRPALLRVLAGIPTRASYRLAASLLAAHPPAGNDVMLENALADSLEMLRQSFSDFLPLLNTPAAGLTIGLMQKLVDSGRVGGGMVVAQQAPILAHAERRVTQLLRDSVESSYQDYNLVRLLSRIPDAAARAAQRRFVQVPDRSLGVVAVAELIRLGLTPAPAELSPLAADPVSCIYLHDRLLELGQSALFPAEYRTQQHVAKAEIFGLAAEDQTPAGITSLGSRSIVYNGKTYQAQLFEVGFVVGDSVQRYLGVSGGYSNAAALRPAVEISGLYFNEPFDRAAIDEQLQAFLTAAEEGDSGGD